MAAELWRADQPGGMSRRRFLTSAGVALGAVALGGAPALARPGSTPRPHRPAAGDLGPDAANSWIRTLYEVVEWEGFEPRPRSGPVWDPPRQPKPKGVTPTSAARLYAYTAIAMYEAVLGGMPGFRSLSGQLTGMPVMPKPGPGAVLDWPTALTAAAHAVATSGSLFWELEQVSIDTFDAALAGTIADRGVAGVPPEVIAASQAHGVAVGEAVAGWAEADGWQGTLGRSYTPPSGSAHHWRSTLPNYGTAIEPYWSEVRPMILRHPDEVDPPPHVAFSLKRTSPFYAEGREVFEVASRTWHDEADGTPGPQWQIALFWRDNPATSGLPSGHWMRIVGQVAEQHGLDLARTVEAYVHAGVALADAFLACWSRKFQDNLLRPVTYVNDYMHPDDWAPTINPATGQVFRDTGNPDAAKHSTPIWRPRVNTPQFPEYPSGHSVSSGAVAEALTNLLGTSVAFTDSSHIGRNWRGEFPGGFEIERSFRSFDQAAQEAAISRLYGGIHYPMGIEGGLHQGRKLGRLVSRRLKTRG